MHHISACPMHRWQSARYAQRRERNPSAGIPEIDEIFLAARHEQAHRWVPFIALDVPSMAGKDAFLAALRNGPCVHGRAVGGYGETYIVRREIEPAYGFAMWCLISMAQVFKEGCTVGLFEQV